MTNLFEDNRNYVLGDPELDLIGDREKLAQWRHKNMGPAFYKLGRKIIYRGADLNAWADACRIDPERQKHESISTSNGTLQKASTRSITREISPTKHLGGAK